MGLDSYANSTISYVGRWRPLYLYLNQDGASLLQFQLIGAIADNKWKECDRRGHELREAYVHPDAGSVAGMGACIVA